MSELYILKRDLNRYYDMRETINKVINYLKSSIEKLELACQKNTLYSIDGVAADQNAVSKKRNELIAKRDELSGKIITEINSQIYILKKKIQEEESNPLSDLGVL